MARTILKSDNMCGIVGCVFPMCQSKLLKTPIALLKQLEYRGYDSAGVAWKTDSSPVQIEKVLGDTSNFSSTTLNESGQVVIGHTRWATHGSVSEKNAHPHKSACGRVVLVHNGIIENYEELKSILHSKGVQMETDTDTEVLANWIAYLCFSEERSNDDQNLCNVLQRCIARLEGTFAFVAMFPKDDPFALHGAKRGSPLSFAEAQHGLMFCSDASCFSQTDDISTKATHATFLDENEIVRLSWTDDDQPDILHVCSQTGTSVTRNPICIVDDVALSEKNGNVSLMEQEIMQQPDILKSCILSRLDTNGTTHLGGLVQYRNAIYDASRVIFVGCGTSLHAAMIAAHAFRKLVGKTAIAINATEAEESHLQLENDVLVACSQSGETMDVIRALRKWKSAGCTTFGICNGVNSTIFQLSDAGIYMRAGKELAVASTKTFASQVLCGVLLAIAISNDVPRDLVSDALSLSVHVRTVVDSCQSDVQSLTQQLRFCTSLFVAGRGCMVSTAMESALKLKEIARIHAEGVSAAEFKHGPFALLGPEMVVIFISHSDDELQAKASASEIVSRGAMVIEIGNTRLLENSSFFIKIPTVHQFLFPALAMVPIQLLALRLAEVRGFDPDRPRNLAKCVTVS